MTDDKPIYLPVHASNTGIQDHRGKTIAIVDPDQATALQLAINRGAACPKCDGGLGADARCADPQCGDPGYEHDCTETVLTEATVCANCSGTGLDKGFATDPDAPARIQVFR